MANKRVSSRRPATPVLAGSELRTRPWMGSKAGRGQPAETGLAGVWMEWASRKSIR